MGKRRFGMFAVALLGLAAASFAPAALAATTTGNGCYAHHVPYVEGKIEVHYTPGCTGHDEPEIDPLSALPGSASDLTWTIRLPKDGTHLVADTGPAFWVGGTVTDPHSLFGQAFLEVQFYPDSIVTRCGSNGGYAYGYAKNEYTVCTPVWSIVGSSEPAAFNAMLTPAGSTRAMVMHAGDMVTVHYFGRRNGNGAHIVVSDLNTGQQGQIQLVSPTDGPLNPAYSVQRIGNALKWGIVHDAPNSFVWEIGHESAFGPNPGHFCAPGNTLCDSYNAASWAGTQPLRIVSVSFGTRGPATRWAVVSDYGGKRQVTDPHETGSTCTSYGGPFCIYPWYTRNRDGTFSYGVDFPSTAEDFGRAAQFAQTTACGGPFGPNSTYCMTRIQ
jgi:hypothetical protein